MESRNPFVFTMDSSTLGFGGFSPFSNPGKEGKRPGDSDYPQFPLPFFITSERMFGNMTSEVSPKQERAFTIANKATTAIEQQKFEMAEKMAFHSLSIDPGCVDAWRILCKCLNPISDGDTVVCATREVMNFARTTKEVRDAIQSEPGMFYSISTTRPYIRILTDLASTAIQSEQLDVAIMVYEEIIRLNYNDNTGSRDPLLACYMKLLGRIMRFPKTKFVRTFEQVEAFTKLKLSNECIFEDDNLTVRWFNMLRAYAKKGNWKELAKAEYNKNDLMFKVAFDEICVDEIKPMSSIGYCLGSKSEDVRAKGQMIKEALKDWPSFLIDCYKLIRKKTNNRFIQYVRENTPNPESELSREYKVKMKTIGETFLEEGRRALRGRDFLQAVQKCTFAKRGFFEAAQPSRRWYLHAPFAVVSNRSTGAAFLSMWNLVRIDTRYTLEMKPDHERSYYALFNIAEAFNAKQLVPEFKKIGEEVKANPKKTPEEWKELSQMAIGLTSIPALVLAAKNKLTNEDRERLIKVGIDDMYTTVNFGSDVVPVLPYLKESDLEKLVEKK